MDEYARNRDLYFRYALKICGDTDEAEDLVQDGYLEVYRILEKDPDKEICKRYIYLTLRCIWIDKIRKTRDNYDLRETIVDEADLQTAVRHEINHVLKQMPLFEREILIGCYEQRIGEFADFLGVRRETVWRWKKSATKIFESKWQKNLEEPEIWSQV